MFIDLVQNKMEIPGSYQGHEGKVSLVTNARVIGVTKAGVQLTIGGGITVNADWWHKVANPRPKNRNLSAIIGARQVYLDADITGRYCSGWSDSKKSEQDAVVFDLVFYLPGGEKRIFEWIEDSSVSRMLYVEK